MSDDVRAATELAFGADFRDVRIRTDADAAAASHALNARAFTVGNEIHFRPEDYRPHEASGQELIAHELTHVVQQWVAAAGGTDSAVVQRQPATTATPAQPNAIMDDATEQAQWRQRVDGAVRSMFGIRGDAIGGGQVDFVNEAEFGRRFPGNQVEEVLFNLFLAQGQSHTGSISQILDYNHHPFLLAGVSSPSAISQLRTFVQQGISRGFFDGQSREYDVTTGRRFPVYRVTPRQLIAESVGGVTDIAPDRLSRRTITMQIGAYVDTLVHEVCHFYMSNAFRDMVHARSDRGEYLRGARISQILFEGFAEYFAQQVMEANVATLGPSTGVSYPEEVRVVSELADTLDEDTLRRAYFHGDARAIARIRAAIDLFKETDPDLMIPESVVDARVRETQPRRR